MTRKLTVMAAVTALGLAIGPFCSASAQIYPSRPIKLIVPYAAGTQPDIMGRIIAQAISSSLGPVIVDNRPGAAGTLGSKVAATAESDGYTLLLGGIGNLAVSPAFYKSAGYDPVKSFVPVAMVAKTPFVLAVSRDISIHTVRELVAYAQANPGKLNFGGSTGTPPHLACELFKAVTATDILHVPYKSGLQAVNDLLGGQVQMSCEATSLLLTHIQTGRIIPLAVMSPTRLPELPEVPTTLESGLPDLVVSVWSGVVAPAGTPEGIVKTLNANINAGLGSPNVRESLAKLGAQPTAVSSQEFEGFIAAEISKWADMVRLSGAKFP